MSAGSKLLMGSASNIANLVLQIASGFIIMPMTIIALGDTLFGIWTLVAAFMGYYGLMDFGLTSAVSRFISRALGQNNPRDVRHYTATSFYVFLGICLLIILVTIIASFFTHYLFPNAEETRIFNDLLFVFCFNAVLMYPCNVFAGVLTSHLRYDIINGIKILAALLRLVGTIVLLKSGYGIYALAVLATVSNMLEHLPKIYFAYRIDPYVSVRWQDFSREKLRDLFGYSIYTYIANVADILRLRIAPFMITVFVSVAAVTHFRVGFRLIEFYSLFIVGIFSVLIPYFSRKQGEGNDAHIRQNFIFSSRISVVLSSFIGFAMIFYGRDFIEVWMGKEYNDAFVAMAVLTIGYIFALSQNPSISFLYGVGQHKFIAISNVVEALVNLVMSYFLIQYYGILGAAIAISLPMTLSKLLVQPYFVSRYLRMGYWEFISKGLLSPLMLSAAVFGVFAFVIQNQVAPSYLSVASWLVMHTLLFAGLSYYVVLRHADRLQLMDIAQKIVSRRKKQ